jgi:hypothetical protein
MVRIVSPNGTHRFTKWYASFIYQLYAILGQSGYQQILVEKYLKAQTLI